MLSEKTLKFVDDLLKEATDYPIERNTSFNREGLIRQIEKMIDEGYEIFKVFYFKNHGIQESGFPRLEILSIDYNVNLNKDA